MKVFPARHWSPVKKFLPQIAWHLGWIWVWLFPGLEVVGTGRGREEAVRDCAQGMAGSSQKVVVWQER